jgi:hypothetical protein
VHFHAFPAVVAMLRDIKVGVFQKQLKITNKHDGSNTITLQLQAWQLAYAYFVYTFMITQAAHVKECNVMLTYIHTL